MSDIKLFRIANNGVREIEGESAVVERALQSLVESNCEPLLGVTFVASEYATGRSHAGRIDTLGIDENGCPVIIEYKRSTNENVINQGLFYLDWLLDHKAEFQLLVQGKLRKDQQRAIDWSAPRLVCIAGDFTRYDLHAVQQINRNIELIRYRHFGRELLALQLVHRTTDAVVETRKGQDRGRVKRPSDKPHAQAVVDADPGIRELFAALRTQLLALGDDVQEKQLKLYLAFRRIKNFCCVVVQKRALVLYLKVRPSEVPLEDGYSKDVSNRGHWGTGDLELTLRTPADLKRAEPLIRRSYEAS